MKISNYSIYHWSFQFAIFCELNRIYKVVLSKVNGKKNYPENQEHFHIHNRKPHFLQ